MRLKFAEDAGRQAGVEATLMVRHPNFNGTQKNSITQYFTPPRYINKMSVSRRQEHSSTSKPTSRSPPTR